MTTPNNPFGADNHPSNDGYGGGDQYGQPYGQSFDQNYSQGYQQDPFGGQYSGGFENSPLNATTNKAASWALGLGIASIVFVLAAITGIGALLTLLSPFVAIAGIIVAIVALVKARKITGPGKRTGFAVTGLILSILTLIAVIALVAFTAVLIGSSGIGDCASLTDPAAQQQCVEDVVNSFQ
ncbi:putative membrane protein [Corynebacterium deserti GIMN1.010]|uniref:Putative membrane protein n=1 Tax=Corynebacterium deserti GIMN1.010 TaxID=931089 RepID=A0A0M4CGJ1_9CORY|nr:DUF4190 domain-containing protein [Corynebacterium deserti]ALC06102.1 putative membrane protein [Corynebacterium deserti GIMN1.010]